MARRYSETVQPEARARSHSANTILSFARNETCEPCNFSTTVIPTLCLTPVAQRSKKVKVLRQCSTDVSGTTFLHRCAGSARHYRQRRARPRLIRHHTIASRIRLPLSTPVVTGSHGPALVSWWEAAALAYVIAILIIHGLPVSALIAMLGSHGDTCVMDKPQSTGQSSEMRDWRTPEQELEDQRSRRWLRLDAWAIGIALTGMLLVMARELFRW